MELRLSETASGLNNAIFARAFKSYVCCKMMHKCFNIIKGLTELYIIMHIQSVTKDLGQRGKNSTQEC